MYSSTFGNHPSPNYWLFFVPFSICAFLGVAGIIASEIFMPQNAAGRAGLLTVYRYVGTMSLIWASIAIWSWHQIRMARVLKQHSLHRLTPVDLPANESRGEFIC